MSDTLTIPPAQSLLENFILKHKTEWCRILDIADESLQQHVKFAIKNASEYVRDDVATFRDKKYKPRPHLILSLGPSLEAHCLTKERSHQELVQLIQKMYMTAIDGCFIALPFNPVGRTKTRLFTSTITLEASLFPIIPGQYSLKFFKDNKQISYLKAAEVPEESTCLLIISKVDKTS